jgi:hypothetical protein
MSPTRIIFDGHTADIADFHGLASVVLDAVAQEGKTAPVMHVEPQENDWGHLILIEDPAPEAPVTMHREVLPVGPCFPNAESTMVPGLSAHWTSPEREG